MTEDIKESLERTMRLNIFKESYKITRANGKEIYKGFGFRHHSDVALALDAPQDDECYRQLKLIYPHVVSCVDIGKLTGQLLRIISKLFQGGA